jgi:pimeloyl-ACP methyl ester carboxylesterase
MNESRKTEATYGVPELAKVAGVEECNAVINGVRWRYLHAGSGPALLLVHGWMGYSFSWRFVMQELAHHFSVYAVDLPGCGFSERSGTLPGTLASDAEGLLNFMDHLGIEQFDVLGTSRGGGLTIALAGLMAERGMLHRLRRLVLSAPLNPWSKVGLLRIRMMATKVGSIYVVHLASRLRFILRNYFIHLYGVPESIPPGSFLGYQAGLEPAGSFEHIWNTTRSWVADLKRIETVLPLVESVPALLLWGEWDRAVHRSSASELHRRWKNSAVLMMERIGHMPYEEVPQEFNRIVLDFLLHNTPATPLQTEAPEAMAQATLDSGRA